MAIAKIAFQKKYFHMDDEIKDKDLNLEDETLTTDTHSDYTPADKFDAAAVHHLSGRYRTGS